MVFIYFVVSIIWLVTWGITTTAVIHNRGYFNEDTKWFWLGFFFTFFAVIVAATKPEYQPPVVHVRAEKERQQEILNEGGWKCVCGRVNNHYVSSCACGKNRRDVEENIAEEDEEPATPEAGPWKCDCGRVNFGEAKTCLRCGKRKPRSKAAENVEMI